MRSRRDIRNGQSVAVTRTVTLDEKDEHETIDLKLLEAIERLERAQNKALNALGSMLGSI